MEEPQFPEFNDPHRADLIKEVFKLLQCESLPASTHAALWLSHMDNLTSIVRTLQDSASSPVPTYEAGYIKQVLTGSLFLIDGIIKPYLSRCNDKNSKLSVPATPTSATTSRAAKRPRIGTSSPHAPPSSPPLIPIDQELPIKRSQIIVKNAHERDQGCVITEIKNKPLLQVGHIYPFYMSNTISSAREQFWKLLKIFWPVEKVSKWENEVGTPARSEILSNVITLSTLAHAAWDTCLFALKPIRQHSGDTKLDVEFYWLKRGINRPVPGSQVLTQPSFPSNLSRGDEGLNLYHNSRGTAFCSGDVITLKTNVPDLLPLPSLHLLEMQWHLSRLAAMSGAADVFYDEVDDDSDDGRDDRGLPASSPPSKSSKIFSSSQPKDSSTTNDNDDDDDEKLATPVGSVVTGTVGFI